MTLNHPWFVSLQLQNILEENEVKIFFVTKTEHVYLRFRFFFKKQQCVT
jgi:hypothetical protein